MCNELLLYQFLMHSILEFHSYRSPQRIKLVILRILLGVDLRMRYVAASEEGGAAFLVCFVYSCIHHWK